MTKTSTKKTKRKTEIKYSGVHLRVSTLKQPSFQIKSERYFDYIPAHSPSLRMSPLEVNKSCEAYVPLASFFMFIFYNDLPPAFLCFLHEISTYCEAQKMGRFKEMKRCVFSR